MTAPEPNDDQEASADRRATIALDAFGTDACPDVEVEGAVMAARRGVQVLLVGDEARIRSALARFEDHGRLPITTFHAPDSIRMEDSPAKAVRNKPEASMPVCFDRVKAGDADAVMSAGNSGAMLACGLFKYRRIKGVDRPALVTSMPTVDGFVNLLDAGGTVDCRPINLVQFAVLGAVYNRFKHGRSKPRVGVLSNGTEEGKGTELTRMTHAVLVDYDAEDFEYVGYVEGHHLFGGEVDVVVTDGFTGNVALKIAEATGRLIGSWLKRAVTSSTRSKLGGLLLKPAFDDLKTMLNPDTYGAAPLLGVSGMAFICHGGSSAGAIARALELATRSVDEALLPQMGSALARYKPLFEAAKDIEAEHRTAKVAGVGKGG